MVYSLNVHLFYPMLFTTIIILGIITGLVIVKYKDSKLFQNIFNRHSEEHEDTTDKMKDMHDNVIKADFTKAHEKEIDTLERKVDKMEQTIIEMSNKLDIFIAKVIELENR